MSPNLKPLLLPRLVERRKLEQKADQCYVYLADNGSSSDIASPLTPTFSQRGGHVRYSSSTSSLELPATCNDVPASPTQMTHAVNAHIALANITTPPNPSTTPSPAVTKASKRSLPDVEEEPFEREDEDDTVLPMSLDSSDFLDRAEYCLCNEECDHRRPGLVHSATFPLNDVDYELGFLSDSDFRAGTRTNKKRRGRCGVESPLSGLTARLSNRLPSLSRWRSSERRAAANPLSFTTASETTLEHRPSLSIAPSSRSSSVSGRGRRLTLDRTNEPPLPPTPALSFYESSESISLPTPIDVEAANAAGQSLERERAMATTPLLPPLMTEIPPSAAPSAPQSPLEFPKIEPHHFASGSELNSPQYFPSPVLSSKPSISSFRHIPGSSLSAPPSTCAFETPSPIFSLDLNDSWSDRLGHANFTIIPKPYVPEEVDLLVLQALRADWDQARINFTKHLVRTGEHYGTTSKTYQLTEAKWAEIEQEWRSAHDSVVDRFAAICNGNGDTSEALRWRRQQEDVSPSTVPRMLDAEGKFPELGDEDIVGPMVRDAAMARDLSPPRDRGTSRFWRSIMGRVTPKK